MDPTERLFLTGSSRSYFFPIRSNATLGKKAAATIGTPDAGV